MFSAKSVKSAQIPFHTRTDRGFQDNSGFQSMSLGAFWQKYYSSALSPCWMLCSFERKTLFCLTVQNSFLGSVCCVPLCLKIHADKADWQSLVIIPWKGKAKRWRWHLLFTDSQNLYNLLSKHSFIILNLRRRKK